MLLAYSVTARILCQDRKLVDLELIAMIYVFEYAFMYIFGGLILFARDIFETPENIC